MYNKPNDYIQQIANHLKKNIAKGYTMDSLKFSLMKQGYSRISIEKAIELANEQLAAEAPMMKEKPEIKYTTVPEIVEQKQSLWKKFKNFFKKDKSGELITHFYS